MDTQATTQGNGKTPLKVTPIPKGDTLADLQAQVRKLREENEALLKSKASGGLKVSEKGGVSLYGLGRFPVTLFKDQWLKLLAKAPEIAAFLKAHDAELSVKPAKPTVVATS